MQNIPRTGHDRCIQPELGHPDAVGHDDGQQHGHDLCPQATFLTPASSSGAGSYPRTIPKLCTGCRFGRPRADFKVAGQPLPCLTSGYGPKSEVNACLLRGRLSGLAVVNSLVDPDQSGRMTMANESSTLIATLCLARG